MLTCAGFAATHLIHFFVHIFLLLIKDTDIVPRTASGKLGVLGKRKTTRGGGG
jgi:hypothetical protein